MDLRKWSDAELALRRSVAVNERLGAAYLALGSCLLDAARGHYDLSRTYYALGKLKDAEFQALKAIDLGPASADVHFLLGNILLRLGERQEALAQFQECLRLSPGAPLEALARDEIKRLRSEQESHE